MPVRLGQDAEPLEDIFSLKRELGTKNRNCLVLQFFQAIDDRLGKGKRIRVGLRVPVRNDQF